MFWWTHCFCYLGLCVHRKLLDLSIGFTMCIHFDHFHQIAFLPFKFLTMWIFFMLMDWPTCFLHLCDCRWSKQIFATLWSFFIWDVEKMWDCIVFLLLGRHGLPDSSNLGIQFCSPNMISWPDWNKPLCFVFIFAAPREVQKWVLCSMNTWNNSVLVSINILFVLHIYYF